MQVAPAMQRFYNEARAIRPIPSHRPINGHDASLSLLSLADEECTETVRSLLYHTLDNRAIDGATRKLQG